MASGEWHSKFEPCALDGRRTDRQKEREKEAPWRKPGSSVAFALDAGHFDVGSRERAETAWWRTVSNGEP